jgi:hypothetical protein
MTSPSGSQCALSMSDPRMMCANVSSHHRTGMQQNAAGLLNQSPMTRLAFVMQAAQLPYYLVSVLSLGRSRIILKLCKLQSKREILCEGELGLETGLFITELVRPAGSLSNSKHLISNPNF